MDFALNEEQLAIRNTCREFAEREIQPIAEQMDATGQFPYALIRQMGELGLLGLPFPFTDEYPVSRYWRSVKINEIGEGTSEVQRMVIAKHLLP